MLLFTVSVMNSQTKEDLEIDRLTSMLSWKSVTITCNYVLVLMDGDSVSNKLVQIGKPATERLINAVNNPEKTVAIHIILTRICEPKKYNQNISTIYIYRNCNEALGWHHVFNGITWKWIEGEDESISDTQVAQVYNYWKTKLIDKKRAKLRNDKQIAKAINDEDKELYPCSQKNFYQ